MYFEKEDTNTLDSKGEFLITLLSSLAEEESRSISENGKWCLRKRFADGKYTLPYKQFLGYKKGPDGAPELIAEEAKIIQCILCKAYNLSACLYSNCKASSAYRDDVCLCSVRHCHAAWT